MKVILFMFIYRSPEGACKTKNASANEGRACPLTHENMNHVTGWIDDKHFR